MAFIELHYHSDALGTGVTVNVILPEKAKTALRESLEVTINLYISSFGEEKPKRGRRKQ